MVTASLVLLPIAWITDAQFPIDMLSWSWAIGLTIVSGLIPIALVMAGSRLIGAVDTATLCVIEPIVALFVSMLILNEVSSMTTLNDGFLVIASALLLVRTQQKNNRVPQQFT